MRENGELSVENVANTQMKPDEYYLEVMKASMVKNFHTVQSTDLARNIQKSMLKTLKKRYSKVIDLGVRSARFFVLTGARMPAVLVETSFISNKMEEKRLTNPVYQANLAEAVFRGIKSFFRSLETQQSRHTAIYFQ